MKKIIAILAFALVAFGAVSCKKDKIEAPFKADSLEDFYGTVWMANNEMNTLLFSFYKDGIREYVLNVDQKIVAQYTMKEPRFLPESSGVSFTWEKLEVTESSAWKFDAGKGVFELKDGKLDCYSCDDGGHKVGTKVLTATLKRGFKLSSLKFADAFVPEAVDLGELPLANGVKVHVKWAGWNVGATKEKESGLLYAWGEHDQKSVCTKENYVYGDGYVDYSLDKDVARLRLGAPWRMPTGDELTALFNTRNSSNFSWSWETTTINGWRITRTAAEPANLKGNSIFIPLAGWVDSSGWKGLGAAGYYWSTSLKDGDKSMALEMYIISQNNTENTPKMDFNVVYWADAVRPVCDL